MPSPVLSQDELGFIGEAAEFLDHPSLLIRTMNALGEPLEALQRKLPESIREKIGTTVHKALQSALVAAVKTIPQPQSAPTSWQEAVKNSCRTGWWHTAGVATTGAIGGIFGLIALPLELPISTTMMLRGISDVAAKWGMDVTDPYIQLECLYVFTLGSSASSADDDMDSAYLGSRIAFEQVIRTASTYLAKTTAAETVKLLDSGVAPALLKLITRIAASFELTVTEKLLAESVPLVGAVGGAAINGLFCDYFVDAARYHFGILYLEEQYGRETIAEAFIGARSDKIRAQA